MECLVTFSPNKATLKEVQNFEVKYQLTLPDDYQKFITLHNGAKFLRFLLIGEYRWRTSFI